MSKHQKSSKLDKRLPVQIDPIRLATAGQQLIGELEISRLPRLSELLTSNEGVVEVALNFDIDVNKIHYVRGLITADLSLSCQRCLNAMPWQLSTDVSLAFIAHEHQIDELVEEYEPYIVSGDPVVLSDLLEDEILLALPQVPLHDESECSPAVPLKEFDSEESSTRTATASVTQDKEQDSLGQSASKRKNPFEVLASIKSDSKE